MSKSYFNSASQDEESTLPELEVSRSEMISRILSTDNGEPFTFKGREYLKAIYDLKHRSLILVASRQAEKSTFLAKDMLIDLIFGKNERLLYVSSNENQVNEFVGLKINSQFQFNPILKLLSFARSSIDNLKEKWLKNGSRVTFRAIGNKSGTVRGISVRKIFFDEVQDMDAEAVAVTQECASHYTDTSAFVLAGTPYSSRNILSRLYSETCQYEWIIPCVKCGDNPPLGIRHIDENKPYLFCCHCGERIKASEGRWVAQNPKSKKKGFRICRLMTPNCVWRSPAFDGVLDKYETYPEAQFYQEVLGLPFDSGTLPITADEIYANCADYSFLSFDRLGEHRQRGEIFGAIDWAWSDKEAGRAFTIFAAAQYIDGKIEIVYTKRFFGSTYHNPDVVLNEIADLALKLNLSGIATDHGVGHKENIRLREMLLRRRRSDIIVFEMFYVASKKEREWNHETQLWNIGRTVTLDLVFHRLKKGLYLFPRKEEIQTFAEDILNVQIKYDPTEKRLSYIHAGTGPDDFLHLLNYLSIVLERRYNPIR
ncbi:MAG: hypothetical protein HN936_14385 [Bacteroidetes bacterium]|jgi:hypothetical protein|nr:hypothetical protein [Bacteroidota bacterium]